MSLVALQVGAFRLLYFSVTEPESQDVEGRRGGFVVHEFALKTETRQGVKVVVVEGFCEQIVET